MTTLNYAIDIAGGVAPLAKILDMSIQRVNNWRYRGVPVEAVIDICLKLDNQVTPFQLRPDIYPDPDWIPAAHD